MESLRKYTKYTCICENCDGIAYYSKDAALMHLATTCYSVELLPIFDPIKEIKEDDMGKFFVVEPVEYEVTYFCPTTKSQSLAPSWIPGQLHKPLRSTIEFAGPSRAYKSSSFTSNAVRKKTKSERKKDQSQKE